MKHIDDRLAHLETRQRVNVDVRRAPKRPAAHQPPISRDISDAGRPLPLARFLDEMEAADASWRCVRKNLTLAFAILAQVLKKRKLAAAGEQPIWVESNNRAQLLYTEADRATVLGEAWEMMTAHREDLVRRAGVAPPALPAVPRVLALLQRPQ